MDTLGAGKMVELLRDFASPISATAGDAWSALIGDRVSFWRAKNAMKYQPLLASEAARLGIKLNLSKIPDRYAFSWFEEATKTDEPEIQILFSRLLARAADDNADNVADRRLIEILGRLTPDDAVLFQRLYSPSPFPESRDYRYTKSIGNSSERDWPLKWVTSLLSETGHRNFEIGLENLIIQGCIRRFSKLDFSSGSGSIYTRLPDQAAIGKELQKQIGQLEYIAATELGMSLYDAVRV